MRRRQPQENSYFEAIDDHDQPTDPMIPVVIVPFAPSQVNGAAQPPAYPYLPPAPVKNKKQHSHRPAGGALPYSPAQTFPTSPANQAYPVYPALPARPTKQAQFRQSPIPAFVGLFFVAVQLLLLIRFLLKLLNVAGNAQWLSIVYDVSDLFVFPFRLLFQNTAITLPVSVEVYSLLAILVYGLFSRILVRFLKALLNSR